MSRADNPDWWRSEVGYEIYIRSFHDSNSDGIGDLEGIRQRLDHLDWLGIGVIWITPFYRSPMADFGYDVADYTDIDPSFGTLDDFDRLVADANARGMEVMVDLVPNHTSDRHPWFLDAIGDRDAAHRDWYIWRDPAPDGGPPNNWLSHFGGPAWTLDEATGQYYCHLFLPEQPDLNWANPAVWDAFDDVLRFWLDRGVAGFRIDVAHSLIKDQSFADNPVFEAIDPSMPPMQAFFKMDHVHDLDQPGVVDVYRRWHELVAPSNAVLLGEVYLRDPTKLARYVVDGALDLSFYFKPMDTPWGADTLRDMLRHATESVSERLAWVQCSHDAVRSATRFGGGVEGGERALALTTLYAGLPGMPFLYQGEELGLVDGVVPPEFAADPVGTRNEDTSDSRDGCRTPIAWDDGPGAGFSGGEPWLPVDRRPEETVAVQVADPDAIVHHHRRLIAARRELPDLGDARVEWWAARSEGDPVVGYRRGAVVVVANTADHDATADLPDGSWQVRFDTTGVPAVTSVSGSLDLGPRAAVVLVTET